MTARRSRRELVAAAGTAVLLAGCGSSDPPPAREREEPPAAAADRAILRFALQLEYVTTDFYERLAGEYRLDAADRDLVGRLRADEGEHAEALERLLARLGGTSPARPLPDFEKLLDGDAETMLRRSADIENVGAAAYLAQASRVQDPEVLATLLSIHSVEGRHAAGLNHRVGRSFVPDGPLARPLPTGEVRSRLTDFGL